MRTIPAAMILLLGRAVVAPCAAAPGRGHQVRSNRQPSTKPTPVDVLRAMVDFRLVGRVRVGPEVLYPISTRFPSLRLSSLMSSASTKSHP
jgi:hypothetical protein